MWMMENEKQDLLDKIEKLEKISKERAKIVDNLVNTCKNLADKCNELMIENELLQHQLEIAENHIVKGM